MRTVLAVAVAALCCAIAPARADSPSDWMYEPTTFTEIRLNLPPASYELLEDEEYDEYVEGTFELAETDGVPGHAGPFSAPLTVGVKLKGGVGSRRSINEKAGLKISFNKIVKGQTFYGLEKMTLNNMVQDPTMTHEVLAYRAFDQMNVFAPGTGFAYVWVNGKSYGLHLNLETPDKIALAKRFGPFQNPPQHLYEGEYGADVSTATNPKTGNERWKDFEVDEGKSGTRTDLEALLAAVEGSNGSFSERVAPYTDLPQMTRMWMTEQYIGHWDGYSGYLAGHDLPNNYYLYSDPAGKFQIFPWGTDQTWAEHLDFTTPAGALFADCLTESGGCAALYHAAGEEALAKLTVPFLDTTARCTAAAVQPWREYEEAASEPAKRPPYNLQKTAEWQTLSRKFISERPAQLATFLGVAPPPQSPAELPCPPLRPIGGFQPAPPIPPLLPPGESATPNSIETNPGTAAAPPPSIGRRSVRTNAVAVELRTLAAGHVSLLGTFKASGRQLTACRAGGKAVVAGAVVISCRLTERFKRRLETGAAYLRLTATLTPATGAAQSSTRTIRLPKR